MVRFILVWHPARTPESVSLTYKIFALFLVRRLFLAFPCREGGAHGATDESSHGNFGGGQNFAAFQK